MVYEMKNRFLILGLTGPLGSGCTTTGKFLSGNTRNNISLKDLIKKQVSEEKNLDKKIKREYREIEKIKESISKRLSKKLGPYKNLIIDPNRDPTILKYEREASKRHNILKIYLRKREVIRILKKFLDDKVFHYDNLNNKDYELFGCNPFIYISFTSVILKIAIEIFHNNGGRNLLKSYFERKIQETNIESFDLIYKELSEFIINKFMMPEDEINSIFSANEFIKKRKYDTFKGFYASEIDLNTLNKFEEIIRKVSVNYFDYFKKISKILEEIKIFSESKGDKNYNFALSEILQDWGDNIRATGNPFLERNSDKTYDADTLYNTSNEINQIVKFLRYRVRYLDKNFKFKEFNFKADNYPTLFVVEYFRNPYEVEFFRSRYAEFYLISISSPVENRMKRVIHFSGNRDERDQGENKKTSELYKLDVRSCVLISDIALLNENKNDDTFENFIEKFMRFFALIRSPGCIPPNDNELYMHLAYSHSLKSTCISRKVGAVITGPKGYIYGAGWNDVGEGQVGCGLRTKNDYREIEQIPKVSKQKDTDSFNELIENEIGDYFCYKDIMSKLYTEKKLTKIDEPEICENKCLEKIRNELGIKRLEYCRALHAEENALLQISKTGGMPVLGGTIYTTTYPCELCAKKLYQTGIRTIYFTEPYPESISEEVFLKDGNRVE
jgi:deoxycytidylate deaminase